MPVKKNKPTDGEQVQEYMNKLQHPLKEGFELLRNIIRQTDDRISERIKWNAPSYYYIDDFLTFGPQRDHRILLVFHHPAIMKVKSDLLEGDFKDRRLAWFSGMEEINGRREELQRIIKEILAFISR